VALDPPRISSRPRRTGLTLTITALLTALVLIALPAPRAGAQAAPTGESTIAGAALRYVGQYQGQCFTFMKQAVAEATGIQLGGDYRLGYLNAGAIEVASEQAMPGDIIQSADDTDTGFHADYPGLHTAIVLENFGGGRFRVVDSNSQWDGVVRIRDTYQPYVTAAAYTNIQVHIYRMPIGSGDSVPVVTPAVVTPLAGGDTAIVRADGDGLNLRSTPSTSSQVVNHLPDGTLVSVLDATVEADGYQWQQVNAGGLVGWVAAIYLDHAGTTIAPPPVSPPAPAPVPVPAAPINEIAGSVPTSGGLGLVVWSGGPTAELVSSAITQGCNLRSVWVTTSTGRFVGYIVGAPAFVNRGWDERFPGGEISGPAPMVLLCNSPGAAVPAPNAPAPAPDGGDSDTPPGPAGNS